MEQSIVAVGAHTQRLLQLSEVRLLALLCFARTDEVLCMYAGASSNARQLALL